MKFNWIKLRKKITLLETVTFILFISIALYLILYSKSYISNDSFLSDIILIFGTLIATIVGVYLSFVFAEVKNRERILLASLKTIYSELSFNLQTLNNLLTGVKSMPQNLSRMYDQYLYAIKHGKNINTIAFNGLIYSGAIYEVSTDDNIFNTLQQAYYNSQLTINGLNLTADIFKEFVDHPNLLQNSEFVEDAWNIHNEEIKKIEDAIDFTEKAMKTVIDFLSTKSIRFSSGEEK